MSASTATRTGARLLDFDGSDHDIPRDEALTEVRSGGVVALDGLLEAVGYLDVVRELYYQGITDVVSPSAAAAVRACGLEYLHEVVDASDVAQLIVELDRRARPLILPVAEAITNAISGGRPGPHWVCDRMWIRAQVPFAELAGHPELLEAGHLTGHLAPTGPHRDSWLTHPQGTVSLWAAVGPVKAGNTIELFDDDGVADRISDVTRLRSVRPALAPGDVLAFDADRLHASVRNDTRTTRVSIGVRILPGRRLRYGEGVHWRPFHDSRLVGTPLARFSTARSRATLAALRRARWRRQWNRRGGAPVLPRARG